MKKSKPADIFPWINETIKGRSLRPEDVSLLHCYWQMPRRVFLKEIKHGICMLCGKEDECVTKVASSAGGINYVGSGWFHPLSPLLETKENDNILFVFFQHKEYGTRYKHWLALTHTEPAPCVAAAMKRRFGQGLWAFGYVCKSKLALAWDEGQFATVSLPEGDEIEAKDAKDLVEHMISMSAKAAGLLQKHVGRAIALIAKESPTKPKYEDKSPFARRFWEVSEAGFYDHVKQIGDAIKEEAARKNLLSSWSKRVTSHAMDIFDTLTDISLFNSESVRVIAEHRVVLFRKLNDLYQQKKEVKRGKD